MTDQPMASSVMGLSDLIRVTEQRLIAAHVLPADVLMPAEPSGASFGGAIAAVDWDRVISACAQRLIQPLLTAFISMVEPLVIRLTTPRERKLRYLLRTAKERGYISPRLAKRIRKARKAR